jgi:hypothetical protein
MVPENLIKNAITEVPMVAIQKLFMAYTGLNFAKATASNAVAIIGSPAATIGVSAIASAAALIANT